MLVEICTFRVADAFSAARLGAGRIELCRDAAADGLTPHDADLSGAAALLEFVPVHPIVRPRASFAADVGDERTMLDSIARIRDLGYPGLVLGLLDAAQAEPDWRRLARLLAAAEGMAVTFHRAFDLIDDQFGALQRLAELGCERVLTSGRPGAARHHLARLADLAAAGRDVGIIVMAGGAVAAPDLPVLRRAGLAEVHSSAGGSSGELDELAASALVVAARRGG
ncbi:MAG: copper homeostasis protein CutC [Candidatus Nanopelagicales bacterium]